MCIKDATSTQRREHRQGVQINLFINCRQMLNILYNRGKL